MAKAIPIVFAAAVAALLVFGWLASDEEYLTPKSGVGYWLGIYGSSAMLLLLVYSLRKRTKAFRVLGSIPTWFRVHMLLGIAGPVLILFHSNFALGALNSNVALFAMVIVALSGVVGRYLYGKIHMGLYGRKAEVNEILAEAELLRQSLEHGLQAADYIAEQLNAFTQRTAAKMPTGLFSSLWSGALLSVQSRWARNRMLGEARHLLRQDAKTHGWSIWERHKRFVRIRQIVRTYCAAVIKAAELTFFERLFGLWHVFHLPLFFLMLLAGVVHVWAVHQY